MKKQRAKGRRCSLYLAPDGKAARLCLVRRRQGGGRRRRVQRVPREEEGNPKPFIVRRLPCARSCGIQPGSSQGPAIRGHPRRSVRSKLSGTCGTAETIERWCQILCSYYLSSCWTAFGPALTPKIGQCCACTISHAAMQLCAKGIVNRLESFDFAQIFITAASFTCVSGRTALKRHKT